MSLINQSFQVSFQSLSVFIWFQSYDRHNVLFRFFNLALSYKSFRCCDWSFTMINRCTINVCEILCGIFPGNSVDLIPSDVSISVFLKVRVKIHIPPLRPQARKSGTAHLVDWALLDFPWDSLPFGWWVLANLEFQFICLLTEKCLPDKLCVPN